MNDSKDIVRLEKAGYPTEHEANQRIREFWYKFVSDVVAYHDCDNNRWYIVQERKKSTTVKHTTGNIVPKRHNIFI